jgi:NAD(P)-dependent dehydrogenase (short-subunit alcohol dehydrogenase family)
MQLRGATALVTGGAHRVGRAIALALADAGANVAVNFNRSDSAAADTVADIEHRGVRAAAFQGDMADETQVANLLAKVFRVFPRLDLLVANAGVFRRTPLATIAAHDWDDMMRLNFTTLLIPARAVARQMRDSGGAIVAIADVAAIQPWADYIPYCVAKSCVLGLVRGLAMDLAPRVRVNAVAPGPVLFPDGFDSAAREREIARTALRRQGRAEDVAGAVTFLAESDYITGTVLPVDGGRLLT